MIKKFLPHTVRNKLQSVNEISLCKSYFQSLTITCLVDESLTKIQFSVTLPIR